MTRKEFIEQLHKKELVIRGAGELARRFYENYGEIWNITLCSTIKEGECLEGLERIEFNQIIKNKDNYFMIVCVSDYEAVSFELIGEGLLPGKDFFSADLVAGMMDNKKILLAVGQCELTVTNYIFQNMPCLREKYLPVYYDEYKVLGIMDQKPLLQCVMEVNILICMADYFIYPINLTGRCEYYNKLLKKVRMDCITTGVPLSTFEGYWPQDNVKNYYEISPYYLAEDMKRLRRDLNIERALESGENTIMEKILRDDFYEEETIIKYVEKTLKKFEIMDRKADVKIGDYYRENYKKRKLFLDRGHVADFVLKEYARRILKCCKIDFVQDEIEQVDLNWYNECHGEWPIYPSVRKVLNLTNEGETYRLISRGEKNYLGFEEYIKVIYNNVKSGIEYLRKIEK